MQKNYVYKGMSQEQANQEASRLLNIVPAGGQSMRDAIQGLIVLANIGFAAAVNAVNEIIENGYGSIVDEILTII